MLTFLCAANTLGLQGLGVINFMNVDAQALVQEIRKYAADAARERRVMRRIAMERIMSGCSGSFFLESSQESYGKYAAYKRVLRILGDRN
jgi:hypothetical protein